MYPDSKNLILSSILNEKIPPLIETIGIGTYGVVEKLTNQINGDVFALKTIELDPSKYNYDYNKIINEIEILSRLTVIAPGIFPKYYDHLAISSDTDQLVVVKIMILMEFINGIELLDFVNSDFRELDPNQQSELVIIVSLDILKALNILHKNGIVHRDLKLENVKINFDKNNVCITSFRLIDFGLSCFDPSVILDNPILDHYKTDCWKEFTGTVDYLAPQVIEYKKNGIPNYEFELLKLSDIWSFGVMLYIMVHNKYPFGESTSDNKIKRILNFKNLEFGLTRLDIDFNDIMDDIFVKYDKRISIEKLIEKFNQIHQKYIKNT